jgi:hypothetical protein
MHIGCIKKILLSFWTIVGKQGLCFFSSKDFLILLHLIPLNSYVNETLQEAPQINGYWSY